VKRKVLIPIEPEPEEPSRDLEQELKDAQAKIKQLESVLHYGVEMEKMVPRFEYMVLEAKVEEAKFQQAQAEEKLEAKVEEAKFQQAQAEEKLKAAVKMLDLPDQLRFMKPEADQRFEDLARRYDRVREENGALKRALRNLRETAERLRVPIDEELLEY
jgi:DNA repair exonuclease SbcCD ATPase subunit